MLRPVRRPGGKLIERRIAGELDDIGAIGIDHVHLGIAVGKTTVCDPGAVG